MTSHPTTPDPITIRARVVVVDLEGTTSAAGFILGDLYDHARPRLGPYLAAHGDEPDIAEARRQAIAEGGLPDDADDDAVVGALHGFMDRDVKSTPLKTIQGRIWADGFAAGELESHFFDDVIPRIRVWTSAGVRLAVFSSGSVTSQRPWFANSPEGDLTPLVEAYFDTVSAGPKKEPASYTAIASALGAPAGELVFLTDHPEEVRAALAAGWQVVAVDRPGEPWAGSDSGAAPVVASFDELDVVAP